MRTSAEDRKIVIELSAGRHVAMALDLRDAVRLLRKARDSVELDSHYAPNALLGRDGLDRLLEKIDTFLKPPRKGRA